MNTDWKRYLTISHWLPMDRFKQLAGDEAVLLTERWDVPQGDEVPWDLKDEIGRFFRTRNGARISGRLSKDDLVRGYGSVATPLLFAMLPLLMLLANLGAAVAGKAGSVIPLVAALGVLVMITRVCGYVSCLAALVPFCLPAVTGSMNAGLTGPYGGLSFFAVAGVGLLIVLWFLHLLNDKNYKIQSAGQTIAGLMALVAGWQFCPLMLRDAYWYLVSCGVAAYIAHVDWTQWALIVGTQGNAATGESTGPVFDHIETRKEQCENALKDKTGFIKLGETLGVLTKKMDPFAADPGLPFGLTCKDLETHLHVFGATGSYKTSALLKPIAYQWMRSKIGGMFVLDGKGELPGAFRRMKNFRVLAPGETRIALLQGLDANGLVLALESVSVDGKSSNEQAGKFWDTQAMQMIHAGATFLQAYIEAEKLQIDAAKAKLARIRAGTESCDDAQLKAITIAAGGKRNWKWTLHTLYSLLVRVQGDSAKTKKKMEDMVALLRKYPPTALITAPEPGGTPMVAAETSSNDEALANKADAVEEDIPEAPEVALLNDAIAYLTLTLPEMDAKTRGDVWATAQNRFTPFLTNKHLIEWAKCEESDFDIESVRWGQSAGIDVPPATFGIAGSMVQALIKQRLFTAMLRRGSYDWVRAGEKPVMLLVDEAADLVGSKTDMRILPMARSLGLRCVFAVQSFEKYANRFGSAVAAEDFLSDFQSWVSLRSSHDTGKFCQRKLGVSMCLNYEANGYTIDFLGSAKMAAESPLYDQTHPAASFFKGLLRRGAGAFVESRHSGRGVLRDGSMEGLDRNSERLLATGIQGGKWAEGELMSMSQYSSKLSQPGVAIAEVQRGGVKRRDFIYCRRQHEIPDDLLEQPKEKAHEPA